MSTISLSKRVDGILSAARNRAARSVNSAQVLANWLIGQEIVQEQQEGQERAIYGEKVVPELARRLKDEGVRGYGAANLWFCRQFFLEYPDFLHSSLAESVSPLHELATNEILYAVRRELDSREIDKFRPGKFCPDLAWTHYRALLKVSIPEARSFYEIEATRNSWSARELQRQIASLLFERLSKSRDKEEVLRLANEGHIPAQPSDIFKDPTILEFTNLPESPALVESDLEGALVRDLRSFLLELGTGFAFITRQQRLTLDGDHFYVDLVFYHAILKCYILVDLKVGKLTHEDLGQLQLYVNYYDRERRAADDNPTLGLLLATDKNDAMVRYTLAEGQQSIFASQYQLHLPTEEELSLEIQREVSLRAEESKI